MELEPILKWPGGKRWFVAGHAELIPKKYGRYFEPFLGGGAVFFHLKPPESLLSDTNAELVALYTSIAWRRNSVEKLLRIHQSYHGTKYYYRVRESSPNGAAAKAARTLYLNRTCFNGIYRVNLAGRFNVPIGTKSSILLDGDDFKGAASALRRAELRVSDFEEVIDLAQAKDLVFADPPYTVRHNNNGFVKYNETLFSWQDQVRLAKCLGRAAKRGVKVVATNADHSEVRSLYPGRTFDIKSVERYSSISSEAASRRTYREVVIRANCDSGV